MLSSSQRQNSATRAAKRFAAVVPLAMSPPRRRDHSSPPSTPLPPQSGRAFPPDRALAQPQAAVKESAVGVSTHQQAARRRKKRRRRRRQTKNTRPVAWVGIESCRKGEKAWRPKNGSEASEQPEESSREYQNDTPTLQDDSGTRAGGGRAKTRFHPDRSMLVPRPLRHASVRQVIKKRDPTAKARLNSPCA